MSPQTGWYSDPGNPQGLRWWDGTAWTEHTRGHPAAPLMTAPPVLEQPPGVVPMPMPVAAVPEAAQVPDLPAVPTAPVVPALPKQAAPVEFATTSSITLLPGFGSADPPAAQPRSRWRRSK